MDLSKNVFRVVAVAAKQATESKASQDAMAAVAAKGRELAQATPQVAGKAVQWAKDHPGTVAGVSTGAVLLLAPMTVALPAMSAVGFGPLGPVAGTLAAGAQAGVTNVAAGGIFATVQSAAMGGYGVAAVSGAVQGLGACVVTVTGGVSVWSSKSK